LEKVETLDDKVETVQHEIVATKAENAENIAKIKNIVEQRQFFFLQLAHLGIKPGLWGRIILQCTEPLILSVFGFLYSDLFRCMGFLCNNLNL
jgi:hypothetical protein